MYLSRMVLFAALAGAAFTLAAAEPAPSSSAPAKEIAWSDDESDTAELGSKQVIGMVERVHLVPGDFSVDARIDTGATKTSLDAQQLIITKEDGQDWAAFMVDGVAIKTKVVGYVRIKQHGAASQRRPVVKLKLTLANVSQVVKTTLTDRSNFKYRLLVGVNFLKDHFVVDVSRKYVKSKPAP